MRDLTARSRARRALLKLAPAALAAPFLAAQVRPPQNPEPGDEEQPARLPNGKDQRDAIAAADYEKNLKDARDLIDLAKSFELDLEKDDRFVVSLSSLKKLDDIDRITKRIRRRLKHS